MAEKIATTHILMDKLLLIYRRVNSSIWQCRYKVDGVWQRASTKERDIKKAKARAQRLLIEAEIRKEQNLPVVTRKFRDVARLAVERLENDLKQGVGKVIYKDYIRVINDYCTPFFGKRNIDAISYAVLDEFDAWRVTEMGKAPSKSTLMTQNAALNRVFEEAVIRGYLSQANKPVLKAKGKTSDRRPAFGMNEIRAVLGNFDDWIARGKNDDSKELRMLLRDYVNALVDTGARPGTELMNLKWKQIKTAIKPTEVATAATDEDGDLISITNINLSCEMTVTGKTGTRTIVGMTRTVRAMHRIAQRNYGGNTGTVLDPLKNIAIASNDDFVFRTKAKAAPTSFQKLFENYLDEHSLLVDPITEHKRVFYSLRHTYATLALTNDKVPVHTLAKQMGTSVLMIEKHYSHLKVVQAIEQLRGEETRKLIDAGGVLDNLYKAKAKKAKAGAKSVT